MNDLIEEMKVVLGTTYVMYLKLHAAHWNVEGINFRELHKLFNTLYNEVFDSIDNTAEQIRQLDAYVPSTFDRFVQLSKITATNEVKLPKETVLDLLKDQNILIELLTEAFHMADEQDKQGLANYLAGRIEAHNKHRWMLRATSKNIKE